MELSFKIFFVEQIVQVKQKAKQAQEEKEQNRIE